MTTAIELRPAFSFTHHAIARFMSRVWPTISERPCADAREALHVLVDAAPRAEVMARRSSMGDAMWSVEQPPMRWITKPGEFRGRRVAVVVTVLDGTEDVEAEEAAERDVLEAHRRLEAVPGIGAPEVTSPAPGQLDGADLRAYRAWVALEAQRLAVERTRLRALLLQRTPVEVKASDGAAAELRREYTRHIEGHTKRVKGLQLAIEMRNELLDAMAARLAEVDPVGSAALLARAKGLQGGPPSTTG